jgi:hypothetical protein
MKIRLLESNNKLSRPDHSEARLSVCIPEFSIGPVPPEVNTCKPLAPEFQHAEDMPVYMDYRLFEDIIRNEKQFRKSAAEKNWTERCWFLVGNVFRNPLEAGLYGMISSLVEAEHLSYMSSAYFELTPMSWIALNNQLEKTNMSLMGWIHTHSLEIIKKDDDKSSGLFLSQIDYKTALKCGFSGAEQITMVLDSDRTDYDKPQSLKELFGAWGWRWGFLTRRNIQIVY